MPKTWTDRHMTTPEPLRNVILRTCHWCEEVHPEHLSAEGFPGRAYFCSDLCLHEWSESS